MLCQSLSDGTGINVIDREIKNLYDSGYMHNHMRMYVASIATNIAKVTETACQMDVLSFA